MATSGLILQRYATALHELALAAGAVDRVQADLDLLAGHIAAEPGVQRQLDSPRLTRERKRQLLIALMGRSVNDLARRAVLLLVDKGRAGLVGDFASAFGAVAMAAAGRQIARVQSTTSLDEATRTRLRSELSRLTGKTISLDEELLPELLGGLRVVIGSRMIDGSVTSRLEQIRERLMRAPLPTS